MTSMAEKLAALEAVCGGVKIIHLLPRHCYRVVVGTNLTGTYYPAQHFATREHYHYWTMDAGTEERAIERAYECLRYVILEECFMLTSWSSST